MSSARQDRWSKGHGLDVEYPVTDEQRASLYDDGWALLPGLLDGDTLSELRSLFGASEPSPIISGPEERVTESTNLIIHEGLSWENPDLQSVVTSRRLSSAVTSLMNQPDALVTHDITFFQQVGSPGTGFHQDYSYQPFDRKGCLTLWIALVDLTEDMGPLRYLRGSHHEGPLGLMEARDIRDVYPHLQDREIVAGKDLKAGDAQAHWDLTIHGAAMNKGPGSRDAFAVRYMRSDTVYTGLTHPHWNKFNLRPGTRFADSGQFPRITA